MSPALLLRVLPAIALLVGGPAAHASDCAPQALPPFDAVSAGKPAWIHVPLSRLKRDTQYAVTKEDGRVVLKATADASASAYVHMETSDPTRVPVLEWSWRVNALIGAADNRDPKREDAPVRVIVGFDGDKSTLSGQEKRRLALAKQASGLAPPYATLMYIWDNRNPVGTVIPSAHSARVKMIVAESGAQRAGAWHSYRRNLVQDYQLAFGTMPGKIVGVAVMTDTDNTGAKTEGYYGEIRFACAAPAGR
ncbi:MAG: DUF3047 domain-containing protein [Betaproteobacteria bacterium]|nr:DUF3047 domain-containing protein [Betaproteobacteria bacterium]